MVDHVNARARLQQLLDLAQLYRGWSRKRLARFLGRDASKLVPLSGVPKLDLVMRLADAIEWPLADVAAALVGEDGSKIAAPETALDFDAAIDEAGHAHAAGDYRRAAERARAARQRATTAYDRAWAWNREAGAWDGLGRFTQVVRVLRRGLDEPTTSASWRLLMLSNLANAHYALWRLEESIGLTNDLLRTPALVDPRAPIERIAQATATYVRGHAFRRLMSRPEHDQSVLAARARDDLVLARTLFLDLADDLDRDAFRAIAATCTNGAAEAETALGRRDAGSVLAQFEGSLVGAGADLHGDHLETCGWSCVFACNVALRHLPAADERQRALAVFTNKADEIAETLGNWSLRERVVAFEYGPEAERDMETPPMIDRDDVRAITGTMGRFPSFHHRGWQILRGAAMVDDPPRRPSG